MQEWEGKLNQVASPKQPKTFNTPYTFPEDITSLPSEEVAHWQSRLAAYRGYAVRCYGLAQIRHRLSKETLRLLVIRMMRGDNPKPSHSATERREATALQPEVKAQQDIVLEHECAEIAWKTLIEVYDGQLVVLKDESWRRQHEQRQGV